MIQGEHIVQLACHETHQFKEQCYKNFIAHNAAQPHLKLCPLCRVPIDEAAVVRKIYHKAKPTDMGTEEAFALGTKQMEKVMENTSPAQPQHSDNALMRPAEPGMFPPIVQPPSGPALAPPSLAPDRAFLDAAR